MLLQFNLKNFKSFKNDTSLDLTATKITEHEDHIIEFGNEKVLPVAAIFGANAGGKSNVIDAFTFMSIYVLRSLQYNDKQKGADPYATPMPFLFDDVSRNECSEFEVYFSVGDEGQGRLYNYGFTLDGEGVKEEWLNSRAKTSRGEYKKIFYRNGNELDLSGLPKNAQSSIRNGLEKRTLVVSLGAQIKIKVLQTVRDWFYENEIVNFGDTLENYIVSRNLPYDFAESDEVRKNVVQYLSSFDNSIVDFIVEETKNGKDDEQRVTVETVHVSRETGKRYTLPLENESSGTQKMFALYPFLQNVFESGGALFADELNSRLHPLLVRMIISMFFNKKINVNNAQLIFTTHDAWQLNNNLLRRDEVWFAEKNGDGISALYSLVDFVDENGEKIRRDANLEKNYLLGKYGAIPQLTSFDFFKP